MHIPKNEHFKRNAAAWSTAERFFRLQNLQSTLRKGHYEQEAPYKARKSRATAYPLTRHVIQHFTGQLLLRQDEVEREANVIPDSYFAAAGPEGESHALQMKTLADHLLLYGDAWVQVTPTNGRAVTKVLSPLAVPRWTQSRVLTTGMRTGGGIFEDEQSVQTLTEHTPGGFTTYAEDEDEGGELIPIDVGRYARDTEGFFQLSGSPTPPVLRCRFMPPIGTEVAEIHKSIYQLESEIDGRLRTALTAGQLIYNGLDADGEEAVVYAHKEGANLIFLPEDADQKPVEIPTEAVEMAEERIATKIDELYRTVHLKAQEASANASATETVVQNQGSAALTASLAATIESAEESILQLVAQVYDFETFAGPNATPVPINVDYASIDWETGRVDLTQGTN